MSLMKGNEKKVKLVEFLWISQQITDWLTCSDTDQPFPRLFLQLSCQPQKMGEKMVTIFPLLWQHKDGTCVVKWWWQSLRFRWRYNGLSRRRKKNQPFHVKSCNIRKCLSTLNEFFSLSPQIHSYLWSHSTTHNSSRNEESRVLWWWWCEIYIHLHDPTHCT